MSTGLVLSACGGGGSSSDDERVESDTDTRTSQNQRSISIDECAEVITRPTSSSIVSVAVRLVNRAQYCDYYIADTLTFTDTVSIEPGTVVAFAPTASFSIRSGSLVAVGSEQQRIVFRGLENRPGSWQRVTVSESQGSRIEFVDFLYGGDLNTRFVSSTFDVVNSNLSFKNSTVSASESYGMRVSGSNSALKSFESNQFNGNALAGLRVDGNALWSLDASSDYAGLGTPNGKPFVQVDGISMGGLTGPQAVSQRLLKLNAPYLIEKITVSSQTALVVEAGVELLIEPSLRAVQINNGATLTLEGNAQDPIAISAAPDESNATFGIYIRDDARLEVSHVSINDSSIDVFGPPRISVDDTAITNTAPAAFSCSRPRSGPPPSISIGPRVTHNGSAATVLATNCQS